MINFDFNLCEPLDYHCEGENKTSSRLELSAPANKHYKRIARLKQSFARGIMDMQGKGSGKEDKKSTSDDQLKAHDVMMVLMASKDAFESSVEEVRGLLVAGVCMIDGEAKLTESHLNAMLASDFEKLMGEYLINFILGSFAEMATGQIS